MASRNTWTRYQLLVAFALYSQLPFGKLHRGTPDVIRFAQAIGRTPSALAMKLTNIASLDPSITSTGRSGLRQVSAKDRQMWEEMESDSTRFLLECHKALGEAATNDAVSDLASTNAPLLGVGEDRLVQTTVRTGQNIFRAAVLSAYDGKCCITGLSMPALIVASHIVPWRHDKLNRLNPRNGLALSVLHDKAFDAGFITIDSEMTVRVSQKGVPQCDAFFAASIQHYDGQPIKLPQKFGIGEEFLAFHRQHVFRK